MKRHSIDSAEMVSVGYDKDSKILEIEFPGKRIYQYEDVPEEAYKNLMDSAEMSDRFFAKYIQYEYEYSRIE